VLDPSVARVVRFSVFELDLRDGELRKSGVRLNLPDQLFQLLTTLLERPGELVSRDELRQRLWPAETFVDFEHGLNAAVKRLRDILGDSADTPRFIETVPRRGYRFVAPVRGSPPVAPPVQEVKEDSESGTAPDWSSGKWRHWRPVVAVLAGIVLVAATAAWLLRSQRQTRHLSMRLVPLTTLSGSEGWPDFSPDGVQVAFVGDAPHDAGHQQVYITLVGGGGTRQITNDTRYSFFGPSWSPDGRQIAVHRCPTESYPCELRLISPVGGQDTRFSDFPVAAAAKAAWSPDGRFLAVGRGTSRVKDDTGIYLLPADGGPARRLTTTFTPAFDNGPAFSRDGRSLAYVSCRHMYDCSVSVIEFRSNFEVSGAPRPATPQVGRVFGSVAWTPDGTGLVFGTEGVAGAKYLWRANADGSGHPERIEVAGLAACEPATSTTANHLAFTRELSNQDIYQVTAGRGPEPVVTSSVWDVETAVSPDGRRIAFSTSRSGDTVEVWVSSVDGSGAQQLTHGPGTWQSSAKWSPDGKTIAFDSQAADGYRHIWTINADGGVPTQLTNGPGDQQIPTWSRDGRWVYFAADQSRGGVIWRVRTADRHVERVTSAGAGLFATESADGKEVLYEGPQGAVIGAPLGGGPTHQIVACARGNAAFADTIHGFYYVSCGTNTSPEVHVLDRSTGRDRVLLTLEGLSIWEPFFGLAVSPDGKTVFYGKFTGGVDADLMLIENFR
jgi:Tol biopolymer transport system component/DNA-binding winged helix-turn-helix (wHTH) protein